MKVIILAAGIGKRFNPTQNIRNNIPKSLIEIEDGQTILDINIESIFTYNKVSDVLIVTGFKSELIDKHVKLKYPNETKIKTIFKIADHLRTTSLRLEYNNLVITCKISLAKK